MAQISLDSTIGGYSIWNTSTLLLSSTPSSGAATALTLTGGAMTGTLTLSGGATLSSGQTFTNSGTISGGQILSLTKLTTTNNTLDDSSGNMTIAGTIYMPGNGFIMPKSNGYIGFTNNAANKWGLRVEDNGGNPKAFTANNTLDDSVGNAVFAGNVQSSGKFLAAEGSGTAGGYSFTNDGSQDTGMFSPSDGILDFYSNSQKVAEANTLNFALSKPLAMPSTDGVGINFWNGSGAFTTYSIFMSATSTSGAGKLDPSSDYNMYFRMGGGTNRGFAFQNGSTNVAQIDGAGNGYFNGTINSKTSIFPTLGNLTQGGSVYGGKVINSNTPYDRYPSGIALMGTNGGGNSGFSNTYGTVETYTGYGDSGAFPFQRVTGVDGNISIRTSNSASKPAWTGSSNHSVNDYIMPTPAHENGHYYQATVAGTSTGTEPSWPTSSGSTVQDSAGTSTWVASTAYALNALVVPTTSNGYYYKCTTAGTSSATQPTWTTTSGSTVTDGSVTWTAYGIITWKEVGVFWGNWGTLARTDTGYTWSQAQTFNSTITSTGLLSNTRYFNIAPQASNGQVGFTNNARTVWGLVVTENGNNPTTQTLKNTLDDGSGNMNVAGTLSVTGTTTLGTATATTPSTADNTTNIATTAFVKAQNYSNSVFTTSANGLVPASTTSNTSDFLRRDGTWATPSSTLVQFQYVLTPSAAGQLTYTIPLTSFNSSTDSVMIALNRTLLDNTDYSISGTTITLNLNSSEVTATSTLYLQIFRNVPTANSSQLGAANGVATLDSNGYVPAAELGNVPAVPAASTSQAGIVQLIDSNTSSSTTTAPTANAVMQLRKDVEILYWMGAI